MSNLELVRREVLEMIVRDGKVPTFMGKSMAEEILRLRAARGESQVWEEDSTGSRPAGAISKQYCREAAHALSYAFDWGRSPKPAGTWAEIKRQLDKWGA